MTLTEIDVPRTDSSRRDVMGKITAALFTFSAATIIKSPRGRGNPQSPSPRMLWLRGLSLLQRLRSGPSGFRLPERHRLLVLRRLDQLSRLQVLRLLLCGAAVSLPVTRLLLLLR